MVFYFFTFYNAICLVKASYVVDDYYIIIYDSNSMFLNLFCLSASYVHFAAPLDEKTGIRVNKINNRWHP